MPHRRDSGDERDGLTDDQWKFFTSPISRYMPEFSDDPPFSSEDEARKLYRQYEGLIRDAYADMHVDYTLDDLAPDGEKWRSYWKGRDGEGSTEENRT